LRLEALGGVLLDANWLGGSISEPSTARSLGRETMRGLDYRDWAGEVKEEIRLSGRCHALLCPHQLPRVRTASISRSPLLVFKSRLVTPLDALPSLLSLAIRHVVLRKEIWLRPEG